MKIGMSGSGANKDEDRVQQKDPEVEQDHEMDQT